MGEARRRLLSTGTTRPADGRAKGAWRERHAKDDADRRATRSAVDYTKKLARERHRVRLTDEQAAEMAREAVEMMRAARNRRESEELANSEPESGLESAAEVCPCVVLSFDADNAAGTDLIIAAPTASGHSAETETEA